MSETSPIVALTPAGLPQAKTTMVHAFSRDPMAAYFFPRAPGRNRGLAGIFRIAIQQGLRQGVVDTLRGGQGIAIWLRSERAKLGLGHVLTSGLAVELLRIGCAAAVRVLRFLSWLEARRHESLTERHWYLLNLAVHPERQGQGLGSTLLRHGLERAGLHGVPCYLETSNARNVPFYEKHGFQVIHSGHPPAGGPQVWGLVKRADAS
jgi:ribosomal protein S18 acetylase RimI-like enzyme